MSKRRVVITGLGILSPLGNDLASSWQGILDGRSGIGPITNFDASAFATRIAGAPPAHRGNAPLRDQLPTSAATAGDAAQVRLDHHLDELGARQFRRFLRAHAFAVAKNRYPVGHGEDFI